MSIPSDVQAALERLTQYNSLPYNRETNPRGLPYPGYVTEFPRALDDAAKVAQWIGETGGLPGDPIEMGRTATHIVWRYVGDEDWIDLVALSEIEGGEGPPGPANTLSIGTVESGLVADASITGTAPNQTLNLTLPQGGTGNPGNDGAAATIEIGTVTTVADTAPATVTNSGTSAAAVLDFEIPKGKDGDGAGDMLAATYDPNGKAADAFAMDSMVEGTTTKIMTADERDKLSGIEAAADVTDSGNVGAAIHGASAKTTPVDADTLALIDSAASNGLKKVSWANVKASLKSYFDGLYQPIFTALTSLTTGFAMTAVNDGTKSSGTYTPTPSGGNLRRAVNGGAHTLAAPTATGDYTMVVKYTNNGSAGAITMSGFTKVTGDAFTTTNGHKFKVFISKIDGDELANVVALQ